MSIPHRPFALASLLLAGLALAGPAHAEVSDQSERGFVSRHAVVVSATPDLAWKRLVKVGSWWSSVHTFSGDAANMTLDPVPGGCFCEALPDEAAAKGKPAPPPRGGVEHMRVVYVDRLKALRMTGALGPLQSEAVTGTLTITLKPVEGGTRILFEYVVGGYMRYPADKIAGAVDRVMGEQLTGLARDLGPVAEVVVPTPGEAAKPATPAADAKPPLGPQGVLLPRGRIWSLPPSPGAAAPEPAPVIAPLAPIPATPEPQPAPVATTVPEPAPAPTPATVSEPPPASVPATVSEPQSAALPPAILPPDAAAATPPPAKPKSAAKAKPVAKSKPKPKPAKPAPADPDEPNRDAVNSAFDTMVGSHPQP